MSKLTLQWVELGQIKARTLECSPSASQAASVRLGRDPSRCDWVLQDPSVSGLHVEVFFGLQHQHFYVRNLRPSNPPLLDGVAIPQGERPLHQGNRLQLGRVELMVTQLILTPPASAGGAATGNYGLKCPNPTCSRILTYTDDVLQQGCPWCGVSLAGAQTVFTPPEN